MAPDHRGWRELVLVSALHALSPETWGLWPIARSVGRALVPLPILEKQNKNSGSSASAGDPRAKGDFPKFVCTPEEVDGLEGLLVVPRLGVLVEFRQRREATLGLFTGRHDCRLRMTHTVSIARWVLFGVK